MIFRSIIVTTLILFASTFSPFIGWAEENALVTTQDRSPVPTSDIQTKRNRTQLLQLVEEGRALSLQEYRSLITSRLNGKANTAALIKFVETNPSFSGLNRPILNLILDHRLSRNYKALAQAIVNLEDEKLISEIFMHLSYHKSSYSIRLLTRLVHMFHEKGREQFSELAFDQLLRKGPIAMPQWRIIAENSEGLFSATHQKRAEEMVRQFGWIDNIALRNQEVSSWLYNLFLFDQAQFATAGVSQSDALATQLPKTFEVRGLLEQKTPAARKGLVEWIKDPRANELQKMTLFQLLTAESIVEGKDLSDGPQANDTPSAALTLSAKSLELFGEIIGDGLSLADAEKFAFFYQPKEGLPNELDRVKLYLVANALIKSPGRDAFEDGSPELQEALDKQDFLADIIAKNIKQDVEVINYILGQKNLPDHARKRIEILQLQYSLSPIKRRAPWEKTEWIGKEDLLEYARNTAFGTGLAFEAVRSGAVSFETVFGSGIQRGKPYDFFRFQIQTYLFKKLLSVAEQPIEDRMLALEDAVSEIDLFLDTPTDIKEIETQEELEALFETLESEYRYLDDEMKYGVSLKDQTPIQIAVAPHLVPQLVDFSEKLRDLDYYVDQYGFKGYVTDLLSEDTEMGRFARKKVKEEEFIKQYIAENISTVFNKEIYDELMMKARDLLESKSGVIKNEIIRRFLIIFIENYYLSWEFGEAKNILKRIMERPDQRRLVDVLGLVISYSGPLFLKVLQIVSGLPQFESDEMQEIFEPLLENNVPSAFENVEPDLVPPVGFSWIPGWQNDPEQRYGPVGTMAETRFMKIIPEDTPFAGEINALVQEIATRVRRAGIENQLEGEVERITRTVAILDEDPIMVEKGFPRMMPIVLDVIEITREELYIEKTIANQARGKVTYESTHTGTIQLDQAYVDRRGATNSDANLDDPNFQPIEVISKLTGEVGTSHKMEVNFLVAENIESRDETKTQHMTKQPGISYQRFIKEEQNHLVSQFIAEKLAVKWMSEALFNNRFFHADLHAGNIKIHKVDESQYDVSLLDFGLAGEITAGQSEKLIELVLASVNADDTETIARIFHELAEIIPPNHSQKDLAAALKKHYITAIDIHRKGYEKKHGSLDGYKPKEIALSDILLMAMYEGYKLPRDFTAAVRGISAIQTLLIASKSKKKITDFVVPLLKENPLSAAGVFLKIQKKGFFERLDRSLGGSLGFLFGGSEENPEQATRPAIEDNTETLEAEADTEEFETVTETTADVEADDSHQAPILDAPEVATTDVGDETEAPAVAKEEAPAKKSRWGFLNRMADRVLPTRETLRQTRDRAIEEAGSLAERIKSRVSVVTCESQF